MNFVISTPLSLKWSSLLNHQNDLQVYFRMLDALLAEERISDEISSQTQVCQLYFLFLMRCCMFFQNAYSDGSCNSCRFYYVMIVKRKERPPSTGSTTNALVVVPTTLEFYDSSIESIKLLLPCFFVFKH